MTGRIFDIQRFSVHDGPGIRTTVFLAGCNLRCFWCHNPESFERAGRLQFVESKCVGCGKCFAACPRRRHTLTDGRHLIGREDCAVCGVCAAACWAGALTVTARDADSAEILNVVALDRPFYKNGGGMTLSGGEPLLQPDFARELLEGARREGIRTAVDTAGCVPFDNFEAVLPYTDLFLYDLKHMDSAAHRRATGVPNEQIVENLSELSGAGARSLIRIPVVPGFNDTRENMTKTAAFLKPLRGIEGVELLPFHRLGGGKYEPLGLTYAAEELRAPLPGELRELAAVFERAGIPVKIT